MASPKPSTPFTLSRATEADMEELVNLEYTCFPPFIQRVAMGCFSKSDLPKLTRKYIETMHSDPSDIWIKVVDKASGQMVAASNWRVYVNGPPEDRPMDTVLEWLEGEDRERSARFVRESDGTRLKWMRGVPFIHLHICFTSPAFRRRGAGSMMMEWGCDVADLLGLAGWIEASEEGNMLYKTHGFYTHSKIEGEGVELEGTNMKRDPKPAVIEGGK